MRKNLRIGLLLVCLPSLHAASRDGDIQWIDIQGTDAEPLDDWKACGDEPGFCMGGRYLFNPPLHKAQVKTFRMSKTAVTVGQYRKCVAADKCEAPPSEGPCAWTSSPAGNENLPVNCVTWEQAEKFARWLDAHLPTNAEWEFAARSRGREIDFPWGNDEPNCEKVPLYKCVEDAELYRQPSLDQSGDCIRKGGQSKEGLCDMLGSVSEWTQDSKPDYKDRNIVRGGRWVVCQRDRNMLRVSAFAASKEALFFMGFRIAQSLLFSS